MMYRMMAAIMLMLKTEKTIKNMKRKKRGGGLLPSLAIVRTLDVSNDTMDENTEICVSTEIINSFQFSDAVRLWTLSGMHRTI